MFKVWAKTSVSRRKTKHDRAIRKVTLSSFTLSLGLLSPPLSSLSMVSAKYVRTFLLKCQYEMLQLSTKCSAFNAQCSRLINYSSCTSTSSENMCSSSGDDQEKGKTG
jgi:hypothetical protein